jgi:hypothetical protein
MDTVTIDRLKAAHLQNDVLSNAHNTPKRVPNPIPVNNPSSPVPMNRTAFASPQSAEPSTSILQTLPRCVPTPSLRADASPQTFSENI